MVHTTEILPCPALRPFIRCFTYREWDSKDFKITRPVFATHEFLLTFNLTDNRFGFVPTSDKPEQSLRSEWVLTGIGSQFAGCMTSSGAVRLFSIYFRSTGFHRIFNMPAAWFTDMIAEYYDACKDLDILHEQLRESHGMDQMAMHCENYLLRQLLKSKSKDAYNSILHASARIVYNAGSNSMEQLAYDANMSLKTFERRFTEQVGISPKIFSRIVRFNNALASKMNNVKKSWTSIAHDCGYFDQMHFIRDFKLFSGNTPNNFFKNTPPVMENLTTHSIEE